MIRHLVYITADGESALNPAWEEALHDHKFQVFRVPGVKQAMTYAGQYALAGILVDCRARDDRFLSDVRELGEFAAEKRLPLLGVVESSPSEDEEAGLAEAGLCGLIATRSPAEFLLHYLTTASALLSLLSFEAEQATARKLALESRQIMHDLSQPLSALQGRLQLFASKCDESDPMKETYRSLVLLVTGVSKSLRELQELHRRYV